mgnify:CR=1 FL=1
MKFIKSILKFFFFLILAVIFVIVLLAVALVIIKPYGIDVIKIIPVLLNKNIESSYDHPYLTTKQEALLESAGINPKNIPTEVTPELQSCAESILGKQRVKEIEQGSEPTINEILQLKSCL